MRASTAALLALVLAVAGCSDTAGSAPDRTPRPALALMTSLPIYWTEQDEFGAMLSSKAPPTGVRRALEARYILQPIDTLEPGALAGVSLLLLAQPRPLMPEENVALDEWVRRGGRLLLFADPLLTLHSRYPVGDRRRPQDVVLLSPILRHWGLELLFVEGAERPGLAPMIGGVPIPLEVPGRLRVLPGGKCRLLAQNVVAQCAIGKGRVVVLADAAVLDDAGQASQQARDGALERLLDRAFN